MSEKKLKSVNVEELPENNTIKSGQLFFITSNNVSYLTHTIHKYPAKFIPHVPRWAIHKYLTGKKKIVLDPFCGSGTTLVESILNNHDCVGIDIDPLACLISQVKTTQISSEKIIKVKNEVIKELNADNLYKFIPNLPTLNHWFNKNAIIDLGKVRGLIEQYKDDQLIYNFLIITFSSIIRKVSNADDQSQKTYVSHTRIKTPPKVIPTFINNLNLYSKRILDLSKHVNRDNQTIIINEDIRNLSKLWADNRYNKVDLAITSPPYTKAIDYIYNQMAEYFWVGDLFKLENQRKQNKYKVNYIGTKFVSSTIYNNAIPKININEIDSLINQIAKKDIKHAYIVAKFFIDMEENFKQVKSILKKNAHYIMVIGNNNVSGYYVPSHAFLIKCAERAGLTYVNHFGYEIRNRFMRFPRNGRGGLINEDWVLDLVNK